LIPVKINIVDEINLGSFIGVNARVRIPLRQSADDLQPGISDTAIRPAEVINSITVRGTVESVQRRNVYTTLGSMVERVYAEAGDIVEEGQILGVLNIEDLINEVSIAEASLRIAEINLATAEHNHETLKGLYETRVIPRNELQQSEFQLQSAIAFRGQAQAKLDATLVIMERSVIRAPISGTVTAVIAREGEVGFGRLFVIEDTENLKIITSFREYDLEKIKTGMNVTITSDATGNAEYTGVISRINPAASAFAPVVEFEAEILVTQGNTDLRIGMNANLGIIFK
jgi:RND family efflux transporter MFP subunit